MNFNGAFEGNVVSFEVFQLLIPQSGANSQVSARLFGIGERYAQFQKNRRTHLCNMQQTVHVYPIVRYSI
jgi:hypothetical protein